LGARSKQTTIIRTYTRDVIDDEDKEEVSVIEDAKADENRDEEETDVER